LPPASGFPARRSCSCCSYCTFEQRRHRVRPNSGTSCSLGICPSSFHKMLRPRAQSLTH
jgi:hypothetical protein